MEFEFLGENGRESIHKQFSALKWSYNCIRVERLHHMMEVHHTQVRPELKERHQGPIRKKKESFIVVLYWASELYQTPLFQWKFDS